MTFSQGLEKTVKVIGGLLMAALIIGLLALAVGYVWLGVLSVFSQIF